MSSNGCIGNATNAKDVEHYMNSLIGRYYDPAKGWHNWSNLAEDDNYLELEQVKASGCSYAIKVDKKINTVISWKFTSERKKCDNNYAPSV